MKKIGVALLGLGTVGGGTYRILTSKREQIKEVNGVDIEILHILEKNTERVKELGVNPSIVSTDINNVLNNPDIQIVAEFFGGIEPARSFLIAALKAGKSIVTANKQLFATHLEEFEAAAKEGGAQLYFEASCMGGVPIIRTLIDGLQANEIKSIQGIFNGTTNYILTKMADEGLGYADVLKEAQKLGYAEANPSADVDGFDSMYKLSILSTLCFHKRVPVEKIYREGISAVSKIDIEYGKQFGYTLKLIATGRVNSEGKIEARVHPTFVPVENPLATVKGSFNAALIVGDNVGDIMLYGRGAGDLPTGSAIVSDIVYCAQNLGHNKVSCFAKAFATPLSDDAFAGDFESEYYVRMTVADMAGVLAKIANAFGKFGVSINSMQQTASKGEANIIFMIHKTLESRLRSAIAEISSLSEVKEVAAILRVL